MNFLLIQSQRLVEVAASDRAHLLKAPDEFEPTPTIPAPERDPNRKEATMPRTRKAAAPSSTKDVVKGGTRRRTPRRSDRLDPPRSSHRYIADHSLLFLRQILYQ